MNADDADRNGFLICVFFLSVAIFCGCYVPPADAGGSDKAARD